jgi:hypothetical protein
VRTTKRQQAVTETDLLEAVRGAMSRWPSEAPEGFYTTQDLAEATGKADRTIRGYLAKLHSRGELERVWLVSRESIDGRARPRPAYRLVRR